MLSGHRVRDLLSQIIAGDFTLQLQASQPWSQVYCGLVSFSTDHGWLLRFYSDCDTLDYCDYARSPAGEEGCFDDWYDLGEEPVSFLTPQQVAALERLLATAT